MTTLADRRVIQLAGELSDLKARLHTVERAQRSSQLGNSSIDNGGGMVIVDEFGIERLRLGGQTDGTFVAASMNNPNPPPVPNAPVLEAGIGYIRVTSAGLTGGLPLPMDFSHFNVYTAPQGQSDRKDGTILTDPDTWVIDTGTQYVPHSVWLTAVNLSGKESAAGEALQATPTQVVSEAILDGIITETKLAADAVTAAKIAANSVGTGKIQNNAVDLSKLADGSVNASKLVDDAVTTPKIAALAVGTAELAANSVIAGKIAADQISTTHLVANAVQAENIAAGAVQAGKIAANAVTAVEIAALTITGNEIAANAITAGHITAGSVTAAKLAADLVIANRIIAGTATGNRVEMHPTSGLQAYTGGGASRSFFINAATGSAFLAGEIATALSGSRIVANPGGSAPDVMRFYQGSVYGEIFADPAPSSTAGVFMAASGTNRGKIGAYPGEGFTSWVNSSGESQSAASCGASQLALWGGDVIIEALDEWGGGTTSFTYRNSSGVLQGTRTLRYEGAGSGEPALRGVNHNVKIVWSGGTLYVQDGSGNAGAPINASTFTPSSRALKKNEQPITFGPRTALDIIKSLTPKKWNYTHEWVDGEPTPTLPLETMPGDILRDEEGRMLFDPETMEPLRGPDIVFDPQTPKKWNPHFGFIAEDVLAVAPELTETLGTGPDSLVLSDRDMLAVLWRGIQIALVRLGL